MKKREIEIKFIETRHKHEASAKEAVTDDYDSTQDVSSDIEEDESKFIFKMEDADPPKRARKSSPIPAIETPTSVTPESQLGGLKRSSKTYEALNELGSSPQAASNPQAFFATSALTPTPVVNKGILSSLFDRIWGW